MFVSPRRAQWWCSVCGRPAYATAPGLGATTLGYCTHGPADDGKPRATKLVPVIDSAEAADRLREARLDEQALRRALVKAHTAEGRRTLTSREARVLAAHEERA